MSEHEQQKALFRWATYARAEYPDLDLMYAVPNGGQRNAVVGRKLKAEGVKAGVPDVCIAAPRPPYGALYVEMKYGSNKPTASQRDWIRRLQEAGNACAVCYSWEDAADTIKRYLQGNVI